jgi:xylosylprotein 4-beta-galactosyltransferase
MRSMRLCASSKRGTEDMERHRRTLRRLGVALCLLLLLAHVFMSISHDLYGASRLESATAAEETAAKTHRLAILIPFRNALRELAELLPVLHRAVPADAVVCVLHQVDTYRFNRGALFNAGVRECCPSCDYYALHDVDLVPVHPRIRYDYPPHENAVYHLSGPALHPMYHYADFIGGILLVPRTVYERIDGLSPLFWGWGKEDDEFAQRLREHRIPVERPDPSQFGATAEERRLSFVHLHNPSARPRDKTRLGLQSRLPHDANRIRSVGLSTTEYRVLARKSLAVDNARATLLDIELKCDTILTPWCNGSFTG